MSQAWDRLSARTDLLRTTFRVLDSIQDLPTRMLAVGADLPFEAFADIPSASVEHHSVLVRTGPDSFRSAVPLDPLPQPWGEVARNVADRIGHDVLATLTIACEVLGRPVSGFDHRSTTTRPLPPIGLSDVQDVGDWIDSHFALLPAVVRACAVARFRPLALAIAARSWVCAPDHASPAWAHELSEAGAQAAIDDRSVPAFAGVMRFSAQWFADHGDMATAERHGVREWTAWERLGDTDGMIDVLWHRAGLYHAAGRQDRELDCHERLQSLYEARDDELGIARTIAATGITFAGLGSDQAAVEHLYRAARQLSSLPAATPGEQAVVVETLGRVYWRLGDHYAARRRFHAALRLHELSEEKEPVEQAVQRVRGLLDTPDGRPLPDF
ncbi:hypothetical protein [Saccharothrix sp. Mg75]|uniref:hypothetical protein n=1 Tax=Saccharothrix sp. Mg75 TaxID=3445357 RepID=UPI003EEFC0DE